MKLHQLFQPRQASGRVPSHRYIEIPPSELLRPFVSTYWASEPLSAPEQEMNTDNGAVDRVLPDGCTDILFEQDLKDHRCQIRYIGLFDHPFAIAYDEQHPTRKFGVRFFPGGAYPFVRTPLSEFANQQLSLDALWPRLAEGISERLFEASSLDARIQVIESYLTTLLHRSKAVEDSRMANLLERIFATKGTAGIEALAQAEIISARQMNRMFEKWIGITPKKFSEIVRFQSVISQLELSREPVDWSMLALNHGFFDQAHLIHDFRRFYGDSPITAAREYGKMSDFYNPIRT
ncbi:DUF6597 domain-containing transcriptional factor [Paenibacillus sepulcri]